jgi:type II secretory pathway component GspD/PulD (secretin)
VTRKDKQLRAWIQKQKCLINEAADQKDRDYIAMMWLGYLNGLRLTNAITYREYQEMYDEIQKYIAGLEVA